MSVLTCDFRVVGEVGTNCYFLFDKDTKQGIIVDPGDDFEKISAFLQEQKIRPLAILLTHGHFDHIMAVPDLKKTWDIPVYAAHAEKEILLEPQKNLSGMTGASLSLDADVYLEDGEKIELLGQEVRCILTPGHTCGGMCYYFPKEGILFSGDTLFQESVGRTDFPTGSMSTLIHSIREKLYALAPATKVYPGHGLMTSIENEKLYNPFAAEA